jgi:hypothetical protein
MSDVDTGFTHSPAQAEATMTLPLSHRDRKLLQQARAGRLSFSVERNAGVAHDVMRAENAGFVTVEKAGVYEREIDVTPKGMVPGLYTKRRTVTVLDVKITAEGVKALNARWRK